MRASLTTLSRLALAGRAHGAANVALRPVDPGSNANLHVSHRLFGVFPVPRGDGAPERASLLEFPVAGS